MWCSCGYALTRVRVLTVSGLVPAGLASVYRTKLYVTLCEYCNTLRSCLQGKPCRLSRSIVSTRRAGIPVASGFADLNACAVRPLSNASTRVHPTPPTHGVRAVDSCWPTRTLVLVRLVCIPPLLLLLGRGIGIAVEAVPCLRRRPCRVPSNTRYTCIFRAVSKPEVPLRGWSERCVRPVLHGTSPLSARWARAR